MSSRVHRDNLQNIFTCILLSSLQCIMHHARHWVPTKMIVKPNGNRFQGLRSLCCWANRPTQELGYLEKCLVRAPVIWEGNGLTPSKTALPSRSGLWCLRENLGIIPWATAAVVWGEEGSIVHHGALPLAMWSSRGINNAGTKMGVVWKECYTKGLW